MKKLSQFVIDTLVGGLLIVLPIYLAGLLMMKAMSSVADLVRPLSRLVPDWLPAEKLLSLLLVLLVCFLVGAAVRTRRGQAARELIEKTLFERIPGYATIRSLTHRMAGDESERVWKPAFAEIEEALVPALIRGTSVLPILMAVDREQSRRGQSKPPGQFLRHFRCATRTPSLFNSHL